MTKDIVKLGWQLKFVVAAAPGVIHIYVYVCICIYVHIYHIYVDTKGYMKI
jgi:hypothetical protein